MAQERESVEGVAGQESAGIGRASRGPQTTEEAQAAEKARRAGMSPAELEEAEARDALVRSTDEDAEKGSIPNVGSPDEPGREDANAEDTVLKPGERKGTGPDERTHP